MRKISNTWNKRKNDFCGFELAENASLKSNCKKRSVGACLEFWISGELRNVIYGCNRHTENDCNCKKGYHDPLVNHAEISVTKDLNNVPKHVRAMKGQELILKVTYQPCLNCAKQIVKKGISKVYFRDSKPKDQSGIDFLIKHKIKVSNRWN